MKIFSKDDVLHNADATLADIRQGQLFIYPTDTIYGIGCNALHGKAVAKIRKLKGRPKAPFSIIAPSKEWVQKNCKITGRDIKWLNRLPGPYTLILSLRKKNAIAQEVHPGGSTIGVRIPDHWIQAMVARLGFPIVTTSANKVGENNMTSLEDLDHDIRAEVPIVIYEGERHGTPSQVIDLTGGKEKFLRK